MAGFQADEKLEDLVVSIIEAGATTFVETGTAQGDSANAIARRCRVPVLTCDTDPTQIEAAKKLLPATVEPVLMSSEQFIPSVKDRAGSLPLFFLDAHWEDYWPLLDEIEAIGMHYDKAVIVVHDLKVPGREDDFSYCVGGGGTIGRTRTTPGEGVNDMDYITRALLQSNSYHFFYPDYRPPERMPGYVVIFQNIEPIGDLTEFKPVVDVTVLISAVDEYSAVWPGTCYGLARYWRDCPWPIVWYTNEQAAPCGETIQTGQDRHWGRMTIKALERVESPIVLLMMDDVWLEAQVDTPRLVGYAEAMMRTSADHLQLQCPFQDSVRELPFAGDLYRLPAGAIYRVSLQPAFWRADTLRGLPRDEDRLPGDFERRAGDRTGGLFLAVDYVAMTFINPVSRGEFTVAGRQYVENMGLDVDVERDPKGGF